MKYPNPPAWAKPLRVSDKWLWQMDAMDEIEARLTLRDVMLPPRLRVHTTFDGWYRTLCGRSLNGARKATSDETCFSQQCGKCEGLLDSIIKQVVLGQQIARLERENT